MAKNIEGKVVESEALVRPVLISALATEKCVRLIESDNILSFLVEGFAKKIQGFRLIGDQKIKLLFLAISFPLNYSFPFPDFNF